MTGFDAVLLFLIVVSVFFAAVRGGLKELTTLVSLGLAALSAFLLAEPAAGLVGGGTFALIGAALAIAVLSFAGFQVATSILVSRVDLPPGARLVDRIGGGVFGLARALVLIGLGFLGYAYYLDEEYRPATVNNAMLLPIAKGSASFIEALAPSRAPLEKVDASAKAVVKEADMKDVAETDEQAFESDDLAEQASRDQDYNRTARAGLDELVTTVTTSTGAAADAAGGSIDYATRPISVSASVSAGAGDPVAVLIDEAERAN